MTKLIEHDELMRIVAYDGATGEFRWLSKVGRGDVGAVAGSRHSRGYWQVWMFGVQYLAHRLAVFYTTGRWPEMDVDHINGNRSDNRIANLRTVTRSENMQNQRAARSNSRTGLLGVVPNRKRFAAQIRVNRKTTCLGTYDTPEQAHQAYLNAKQQLHPSGTLHATAALRGVVVYADEAAA